MAAAPATTARAARQTLPPSRYLPQIPSPPGLAQDGGPPGNAPPRRPLPRNMGDPGGSRRNLDPQHAFLTARPPLLPSGQGGNNREPEPPPASPRRGRARGTLTANGTGRPNCDWKEEEKAEAHGNTTRRPRKIGRHSDSRRGMSGSDHGGDI